MSSSEQNTFFVEHEIDESPRSALETEIAQALAELSQSIDSPSGVRQHPGPFQEQEVDFADGSWMARVRDLQDWLQLDPELPASAETFVETLVTALGTPRATDSLEFANGSNRLSITGLNQFLQRINSARRAQSRFNDALDETTSVTAASKAWDEAWAEEEDATQDAPLEPVSATAGTWRISDFTGKRLNLTPSYQRGDVWGTSARQMLIESILRGIPLPSVILLRPEDPTQPHEVVDGKQRLTAILRFVGKHPQAVDRVRRADSTHGLDGKLVEAFNDDYPKFRKLWKLHEHEALTSTLEDRYFFPFKLRNSDEGLSGPLATLQGKYFTEISEQVISAADEQVLIRELFSGTPEYRIPVIVYKRASQSQIHEVFNLYNKQGMHLNAEEIRNAIYHELDLTRAILAASGDSDSRTAPTAVAPALSSVWSEVGHLGSTMAGYGFGTSRYRRTKVLAWVIAVLLGDTQEKDLPSTARHIDDLLRHVKQNHTDPLNQPAVIAELIAWIADSARLHASFDEELWAPVFKNGSGGQKWQELQLVGSLVGVAIANLALPDLESTLEELATDVYRESSTAGVKDSPWARPNKTQTKSQWKYVADIAWRVCVLLKVDYTDASEKVQKTFGRSGLPSLFATLEINH